MSVTECLLQSLLPNDRTTVTASVPGCYDGSALSLRNLITVATLIIRVALELVFMEIAIVLYNRIMNCMLTLGKRSERIRTDP